MRRILVGCMAVLAAAIGFSAAMPAWTRPMAVVGLTTGGGPEFGVPAPRPFLLHVLDFGTHELRPIAWAPGVCDYCVSTGPLFYSRSMAPAGDGARAYSLVWGRKSLDAPFMQGLIEIDVASASVVRAALRQDLTPIGLAAHPFLPRLYVTSTAPEQTLVVYDAQTLAPMLSIPLPSGQHGSAASAPAVAPFGESIYLTSDQQLVRIETASSQIVAQRFVGMEFTPLLDLARNRLYGPDPGRQGIQAFDATTLQPTRYFDVGESIDSFDLAAGGTLRVGLHGSTSREGNVMFIDPDSGAVSGFEDLPGRFFVQGGDSRLAYRLAGQPYPAEPLLLFDSRTYSLRDTIVLDRRPANDPAREWAPRILLNRIAFLPEIGQAVEFHHAALDHYFLTADPVEIDGLDRGVFSGWQRTGESLGVLRSDAGVGGSYVSVCRFYGRPERGLASHFYSASPDECAAVEAGFDGAWIKEHDDAFYVVPADVATGSCPADTVPVFRLWNLRPDTNHRYTTSSAIRDEMIARGFVPEGYGPDRVAFCARP